MALNVGNLVATLGLDKKGFDAGIDGAQKKTEGFASGFAAKMKDLAVPLATVGAAVAAAIGTAAVMSADTIDKAYTAIRVGTGATGEDLEALKSDFDAVFGTIPAGAGEVGTAIADLNTRLGLTGKPLQNMATRFLELSRITGTDVASNIKEVTRLFGNWNVAAEEQTGMLDYLFKVSQSTGIGVDRLSTLTTQYGSTLRGLGFDLKDSVAVLGKFEKEGVNIEAVLAGMKIGLGNLAGKGITDPVEALDKLARQVREAGTEIEAVSIAAEVFGARGAAEMAAAIRSGNLDLGDFVTMLDASEETVLDAADDAMTLGDRMAILQHKAEKALQPVGNLMIGVFETAMPHLEAAGDALVEVGKSVATWAEEAAAAAGPVVDAFQDKMAPVVEFFQGRLEHIVEWWNENSEVFIAAWENVAAAISWVIETVVVPLFEWAWPYIEDIYSGVLDTMLGVAKLFASILAGDWEAAGEALVDITKGAMQALVGVISMGFDAIATGIEFVMNGVAGFMTEIWRGIVQAVENAINAMIDLINGFIRAINSVTGTVGISLPTIGHISLKADKIEAPKIKIPRWSETSFSKEIDEFLKKDEEEEEEEEEDIDKEFEDEPEREPAPALPKSQLPVAPKPEILAAPPAATIPPVDIPETPVDIPEIPENEIPTIPAPAVSVPALDTPVPVSVTNWDQMVAQTPVQEPGEQAAAPEIEVPTIGPLPAFSLPIPVTLINWPAALRPVQAAPPATDEQAEPVEEEDIDKEFEKESEPEPAPTLPKSSLPVAPKPETPVAVVDIPEIPETGAPEPSPAPTPAFSLPIPVTVINWPDTLKPVPAVPLTEEERVTPADEDSDIDEEFVDLPEPTIVWPDLPKIQIPKIQIPKIQIPKIQIPDIAAAVMPPEPDAGALTRILGLIGGGETRVVVELDGYAIGETLFRTWNRRTGGALNG